MRKKKKIGQVYLTEESFEKLEEEAEVTGMSLTSTAARIVETHFKKENKLLEKIESLIKVITEE